MESQERLRNNPSLLKINRALRDFAHLAHHGGEISPLPPAMVDTTATQLLMRLLAFCDVTQGAFLLTTHHPEDWHENTPTNKYLFPTIVRQHINEATVFASLQQFSPEGPDMQISETDASNILLWRRSFAGSPLNIQTQNDITQPTPSHAFFLFKTPTPEIKLSLEAWENVLSLVADAIDTVLANLWLSLRLHELERRVQQQEHKQMEPLKADLLATVSHELRSPLASIKGYTATLLRHDAHIDPEERYEFLQAIQEGSTRLEHIIDRLLELSQIETQKVSFLPTPLNLPALVQEAITATKQFNGTKSLQPNILFLHNTAPLEPADERLVVNGDRYLLRTMLDHLFENAQLYSPPTNPIEVGVALIEADQWFHPLSEQTAEQTQRAILLYPPPDQDLVELWIKDLGIGIAPEHLQPIFERFYRVDTRLTREVNGLGVGLAICKGVIELHTGGLWIESTIGAGSTFHILLPQIKE